MKLLFIAALALLATPVFAADDAAFLANHGGYAAQKGSLMTLTSWSNGACGPTIVAYVPGQPHPATSNCGQDIHYTYARVKP